MYAGSKKTYYRCYAASEDSVLIAAYIDKLSAPDETPNVTNFLKFDVNKGWSSSWADGVHIRDHFLARDYDNAVVALSDGGGIYRPEDGLKIGAIAKSKLNGIEGAANSDSKTIVFGFNSQFYISNNGRDFELSSNKFQRSVPNPENTSLEDLLKWAESVTNYYAAAALSDKDFIIVGSNGSVVYFDGDYKDAKLDVAIDLTSAFADQKLGEYLISGHSPVGYVSTGHPNRGFEMLYHGNGDELFVSILRFKDKIYIADASKVTGGVFTIDASGKQPAEFFDVETLGPARDLRTAGSVLWALSENAVVRFDGKTWESFTHPEDL